MSFDPMAAAIGWLDAYRASDLESVLEMYADDATVECACGGLKTIVGKDAIRAYWVQRLRDYPASDLNDLQLSIEGAVISYSAGDGSVCATLGFNADGQIKRLRCGPSKYWYV